MINIDELISPFGQSSLFMDDATNTCAGVVFGTCSNDSESTNPDCNTFGCCATAEDCMGEPESVTCDIPEPGSCSVTGQGCFDNICCTTGLDCESVALP